MAWFIPLCLLVIFELLADVFAKEWSLANRLQTAMLALLCYMIANTFWLIAMRAGVGLARGAAWFSVVSALLATIIGLWYGEHIQAKQMVGIILALLVNSMSAEEVVCLVLMLLALLLIVPWEKDE